MNRVDSTVPRRLGAWAVAALLSLSFGPLGFADSYSDDETYDDYDASYGYIRVLDGDAMLIQAGSEDRDDAEINQPLLVGDRLWVSRDGRLEALLSDRNLIRLDGETELLLEASAASPDAEDAYTQLRLLAGQLQIVVYGDALGEGYPRIDTGNSTIYIHEPGRYLITADRSGWTEVVAREGYAEVVTDRGSEILRQGDEVTVEGYESPYSRVRSAGRTVALERWGERLERLADRSDGRYVDSSLRYAASSLDDYGDWVYVDRRRAWRPRVASDWRPYLHGRWVSTPSGLTWVSRERWGWVPSHYGSWDYAPGYGWLWYPGRVYSPAWVYWSWTPSYVGWCPVGYYSNYYRPRYGFGFRWGVYGYADHSWDHYERWNFVHVDHLRRRRHASHVRPGHALRRELGGRRLDRGLITTDTRGIDRGVLERPREAIEVLRNRPGRRPLRESDLPDVTPFVRRDRLPEDVQDRVAAERRPRPERAAIEPPESARLNRRPLREGDAANRRPGTLARRPGSAASGEDRGSAEAPALRRRPLQEGESTSRRGDREAAAERRPTLERRPQREGASGARRGDLERRPTLERRPSSRGSNEARADRPRGERPSVSRPRVERPKDERLRGERPTAGRPRADRSGDRESGRTPPRLQRRPGSRPEVDVDETAGQGRRPSSTRERRPELERRPAAGREGTSRENAGDRRSSGRSGPTLERRPGRETTAAPSRRRPPLAENGSNSNARRPSAQRPPARRPSADRPTARRPSTERPPARRPSTERGTARRGEERPTLERRPGSVKRPAQRPSTRQRPSTSRRESDARRPSTQQRPSTRRPSAQRPAQKPSDRRPSAGSRSGSRQGSSSARSSTSRRPSKPPARSRAGSSSSSSRGNEAASRRGSSSGSGSKARGGSSRRGSSDRPRSGRPPTG